ncbi:MAG: hypothetical protein IPJ69_03925 [Deltaproteobacteria bacterium]|nr:MAG: hypothetical protein IPJ69_03925 [Deltaproteobacteria bacterium]
MLFTLHSLSGKIAGIVALLGFAPYILSTIKRKNKPNRATWIIWFVVSLILLTSYRSAGATDTLWVSMTNVIFCGTVAILSIRYGQGGWNFFDLCCLCGAGIGLFLWWYFKSPLPTLYISLVIDAIGALPTLKKAYHHPKSEDAVSWILFWIANTINLFAIETWAPQISLYPLYLFLISGMMVGILKRQRG